MPARDEGALHPTFDEAEMLRRFIETAPDAMVVVNVRGHIVLINERTETLFGYTHDELLGHPIETLVPERFRTAHERDRTAYARAPKPRAMGDGLDLSGRRKDGTEVPVEISLGPLETSFDHLVCAAIRDVSSRRRIEAALTSSNGELEAFSYSVAHDLRAPLRAINGFSRALLEPDLQRGGEEANDYLRRIAAAAVHMGALIDGLLSLSRLSRAELRQERVDLSSLATGVLHQLREAQPEREVELTVEPGLFAIGDRALLFAVFENLLGNAWKFSSGRAPAHIWVGAAHTNDAPSFFVRDDGAGFDMAYASKLFTPFQRLHSADQFPGTGIGLATVRRIITRHGGRIWALSEAGRGATFFFSIPNVRDDRSP